MNSSIIRIGILGCILLFLASCSTGIVPFGDSIDHYEMTLQRTACRGNCPVYSLAVKGDGSVAYEGFLNVAVKGKRLGTISVDSVAALLQSLQQLPFETLSHEYVHQDVTDMPSVLFTLSHTSMGNIRARRILDYQGDAAAPEGLRNIYARMDSWLSLITWQE